MPPEKAKAATPAVPKPAEAEGSEGPDAYPPPARVSVGNSPVYIPEKKLGKGGFGQVRLMTMQTRLAPRLSTDHLFPCTNALLLTS